MNGFLSVDPILTIPQAFAVLAAAVGAAVWLYRTAPSADPMRRRQIVLLTVFRVLGVLLIAALLLNPVIARTERQNEKPPLLILLDSSHSMAITDVDGRKRFDAAKAATIEDSDLMRRLQQNYQCRLFSVGETATPQDLVTFLRTGRPDAPRTHLGEAMSSALAGTGGPASGGMLLVSDGRNNGEASPLEAAALAKARRVPVFTLCLGDTRQAPDVALINHRPQIFAVPEQNIAVAGEIHCTGYGGQSAVVDLLRQGSRVQTKTVALDDHKPSPISFTVRENREGSYRYTIAVHPMPKESVVSNNRSAVFLQVLKAKTRVLVLEGRPSWDAKFLIKALRSDPSIEVDTIFKITADKFFASRGTTGAATPSVGAIHVPKTPADFARYDVIVIGKGYEDLFDQSGADALKAYVADHAGNLVFLRGKAEQRADTLRALEPVQWSSDEIEDVRMSVTEEGQRNPAFRFSGGQDTQVVIQKLPTMISATRVQGEKALSVVLARASGVQTDSSGKEMAVVAYQNYGQGKVLSLVGEGLWRWALLPPELKDYTECYFDFWTQLIRWMVNQSDFLPGQDVSLKTDHPSYGGDDTVHLMAFLRGRGTTALPPATITGPDGKTTQVNLAPAGGTPADFAGSFRPGAPGEYVASLVRPHAGAVMAPFSVYPDREEDRITAADPDLMAKIARAGGGEALTVDQLKLLPDKLRDARATLSDKNQARSAWDRGWVLAIILAIFALEWALRRRFGLL